MQAHAQSRTREHKEKTGVHELLFQFGGSIAARAAGVSPTKNILSLHCFEKQKLFCPLVLIPNRRVSERVSDCVVMAECDSRNRAHIIPYHAHLSHLPHLQPVRCAREREDSGMKVTDEKYFVVCTVLKNKKKIAAHVTGQLPD